MMHGQQLEPGITKGGIGREYLVLFINNLCGILVSDITVENCEHVIGKTVINLDHSVQFQQTFVDFVDNFI